MLPADAGCVLLPLARETIEEAIGGKVAAIQSLPDWLQEKGASFVSLHKHGELRGCIGTIEPYRLLIDDVKANAIGAATRDPRFTPLLWSELSEIDIEVSVLSPTEVIQFENEADALSQLRVGIDGIVFEWRGHRGTFLPQVWESLPNASVFMSHLKVKSGLTAHFWADDINLYRYTVSKWAEAKDVEV